MTESADECVICMSNPPVNDARIKCLHNDNFCKECIDECIKKDIYTCPNCREPFDVDLPIYIEITDDGVVQPRRIFTILTNYLVSVVSSFYHYYVVDWNYVNFMDLCRAIVTMDYNI
ncbi:putative membrane protein [Emiliania huxleyi virus 99B1]|nr:putative membrane protein [Emiliania huxleyi virus 99B1]